MITDAYVPVLALASVISITRIVVKKSRGFATRTMVLLALFLLAAYAFIFIGRWLNLFSNVGLDYSTHTATALALLSFLAIQWKTLRIYLFLSMLA